MFIMDLWGSEMTPFMQSLHFMFGIGALVAPAIAAPFLFETEDLESLHETPTTTTSAPLTPLYTSDVNVTISNSSLLLFANSTSASSNASSLAEMVEEIFHPEQIRLIYPYSIIAAFLVLNASLCLAVWLKFPLTKPHPSRRQQQPDNSRIEMRTSRSSLCISSGSFSGGVGIENRAFYGSASCVPTTTSAATDDKTGSRSQAATGGLGSPEYRSSRMYARWKAVVVVLTLLFMHTYLGLEIAFGSFLTTFAVNSSLSLSKVDGAHLTTLFWSTFTLFRVATVFYIEVVGNERNIFASLTVILIANACLVPFGASNVTLLIIGVALIGIGISSVWACVFGFLEEHFPVTSLMSAFMIVAATLGEFVFPAVISAFIAKDPQILMWVTLFCSSAIAILFTAMATVCRKYIGKAPPPPPVQQQQQQAQPPALAASRETHD